MKNNKRNQGMAFALTMLVLFIALTVLLLGLMAPNASLNNGLVGLTSNSTKFASNNENATQAFDLAESGVDYTVEYFHTLSAPPTNKNAFAPAIWGSTQVGSPPRSVMSMFGGNFSVEVYPDSKNQPGVTQMDYLIESIGTFNGFSEMVSARVEQQSFGQYCYFNDWGSQNGYWVTGIDSFDGPYHSNNASNNAADTPGAIPDQILWHQISTDTIFNYNAAFAYTCVSSSIGWNLNTVGNMVSPASPSDWFDVATYGHPGIATNQAAVAMPSTSTVEMSAALGTASAPSGAAPQVLVPSAGGTDSGGIYINGDVTEMAFSTANAGGENGDVQIITITQGVPNMYTPTSTVVTTITEDPTSDQTTITTATTPNGGSTTTTTTVNAGLPNGAIYVNGNIGTQTTGNPQDSTDAWNGGNYYYGTSKSGGVHGVIANNYIPTGTSSQPSHVNGVTIATNASDNLNFDGSLTTYTQRQTQGGAYVPESSDPNYVEYAGTLGVVSDNIEAVDTSYTGSALTSMEVDGAVLAYNTFDATNIYQRPLGVLTVMGGYIAKQGGYFGVMNTSGTMPGGFDEHYHYDERLASNPPPFFPTTGNQYSIVSWTRTNVTNTLQ